MPLPTLQPRKPTSDSTNPVKKPPPKGSFRKSFENFRDIPSKILQKLPIGIPGLKIWHWNANSFSLHKKAELSSIIFSNKNMFDIFAISETHFKTYHNISLFDIPNFKSECKIRTHDPIRTFGGGLFVYVKENLEYERLDSIEINELEVIWLKIKPLKNKIFVLAIVYRPPHVSKFLEIFLPCLEKALDITEDIVVIGDFNVNLSKKFVPNSTQLNVSAYDRAFYDALSSYGLIQTLSENTRTDGRSQSLIDHIYVTQKELEKISFVLPWSLSDHFPICMVRCCDFLVNIPKTQKEVSCRTISDDSLLKINSEFHSSFFDSVINENSVNEKLSLFYDLIFQIIDKHSPIRTKKVPIQRNLFLSRTNPFREKRNWYKKMLKKHGPNEYYHSQYKFFRNRTVNFDRNSAKDNVSRIIDSAAKAKQITTKFHILDGLRNKIHKNVSRLKIENVFIEDRFDIAEKLNVFFTSISSQYFPEKNYNFVLPRHLVDHINSKVPNDVFFDIPLITTEEVEKFLHNIDINSSRGLDEVPPKVLQFSASWLAPCVKDIINVSISNSIFPELWKVARVTAIPKPDFKNEPIPKNLRPISVLNTLSKVIEKHVANHLYKFLDDYNLIYDFQSGSRPAHSCETALLQLTDTISEMCTKNYKVGILFNDFSKAFDLLDHGIFLKKLKAYKINENSLKWFESYFSNRFQIVQHEGVLSNRKAITSGVPQGSTLGPLAFLIYVNDMFQCVSPDHGFLTSVVDDSNFISFAKTVPLLTQFFSEGAKSIEKWCSLNYQVLNLSKASIMEFVKVHYQNQVPLQLTLNQLPLSSVASKKLLGVTLDSTLSFSDHLKNVRQIGLMHISTLRKILPYTTFDLRLSFYNAFIMPHLTYSSSVWALKNKHQMEILFCLQKRAIRLVMTASYISHTLPFFRTLKIVPITFAIKIRKLSLVFKCLYNLAPKYLCSKFKFVTSSTRRGSSKILFVPGHTGMFSKSFGISGARLWNSLPEEIRTAESLLTFKLL